MIIPFEDLFWLFRRGFHSRGLCRLDLEEAAYLYKCIKGMKNPFCVEIGRYFGGTTSLMLAAGAGVLSIDNHSKDFRCSQYDRKLAEWAAGENCQIVVADSGNYCASGLRIDVLFIDGGHSYSGVKRDFENFYGSVKDGGSVFFHDSNIPGVAELVKEKEMLFRQVSKVCSLLHVRKEDITNR